MSKLLPIDYGVRNLGRSRLRLALSVLGSAVVVLLVIAAGSFVRGMDRSLKGSGSERNVIILGAGSEESTQRSEIGAGVASLVSAAIDGLETKLGVVAASAEVHIDMVLRTTQGGEGNLVMVRGITPQAMMVHSQVQIVEGRMPQSGQEEVMLGALVGARLGVSDEALAVGRSIWIDDRAWPIVGRFVAPGTVMEAEAWAPLYDLKLINQRTTDSAVVVTLDTAEFADIDAFCKQRLDLELVAMTETEYYSKLAAFFRPMQVVAWITAMLIGLGGLFGGLNTMYAAFASRVRELGMLQCLGYRRSAIVISLVQESVLATAAGALIASFVGIVLLDRVSVRFSMGAFGLWVDAPVIVLGLLAGLVLGLVGALPPAWRALRLPIPESLKAL